MRTMAEVAGFFCPRIYLIASQAEPKVLYYLDNIESHKVAVNENYGRELSPQGASLSFARASTKSALAILTLGHSFEAFTKKEKNVLAKQELGENDFFQLGLGRVLGYESDQSLK